MTCPNCKSENFRVIYFPDIQGSGFQGPPPKIDCYSCCECGVRFDDVADREEIITYTYDDIICDQIISNLKGFSSIFRESFEGSQSESIMSIYGHFYKKDFNSSLIIENNDRIENSGDSMFFFLVGGGSFMVTNPIGWYNDDISTDKLRIGSRKDIRIRTAKKYKSNYSLSMVRQKIRYTLQIGHGHYSIVGENLNKLIYNFRIKFPTWEMKIRHGIIGPEGENTDISFYLRDVFQ